jgi:hypothetical protein
MDTFLAVSLETSSESCIEEVIGVRLWLFVFFGLSLSQLHSGSGGEQRGRESFHTAKNSETHTFTV